YAVEYPRPKEPASTRWVGDGTGSGDRNPSIRGGGADEQEPADGSGNRCEPSRTRCVPSCGSTWLLMALPNASHHLRASLCASSAWPLFGAATYFAACELSELANRPHSAPGLHLAGNRSSQSSHMAMRSSVATVPCGHQLALLLENHDGNSWSTIVSTL